MSSAVESVFQIPELMDQILKDVDLMEIFTLQRVNRSFCQTILKTSHVRPRRLTRFHNPGSEPDSNGEVSVDYDMLFACRLFGAFLYLEPFREERCTVIDHSGQYPILHMQFSYTPRSATGRLLWEYPHGTNVAARHPKKSFEVSPSWAQVWLPHVAIRISLRVYRHEHKHHYTGTMQLDKDKAEMYSVSMALDTLAKRSESKWSSGDIVGEWTI
jgi:hypothetical protein